jgi:hypothetical protein
MSRVIWKLVPPNAGRFLTVSDEEADKLIAAGEAQCARENGARDLKQPVYKTRDLRSERGCALEPEPPHKKKRKRRTKAEIEAEKAAAAVEPPAEESDSDGD